MIDREALLLARSPSYEDRATAATRLAPCAGVPEADHVLLDLLLDREDTAVSQAAADGLLARRDSAGVRLYALAFARAQEDTRNKLGDCLYDDDGTLWSCVRDFALSLSESSTDDSEVQSAAQELLAFMREEGK